ncbi:MAG: hypothetical protein LUQ38_00205 [Methanotrichaceae archaeon]|nr:hypothetical protein [Methanotrichaceae archaeon]
MKLLTLILIITLCLQVVASASTHSVTIGPFMVSFDLNTTKNLIIQPQGSYTRKGSEDMTIDSHDFEIIDSNTPDDAAKAQISINEYSDSIPASLESDSEQAAKLFHILDRVVTTDYRVIDGNRGYIVKGTNKNGRIEYAAGYRIGNQIEVTIIGALPEIKNLLGTIHVEKR